MESFEVNRRNWDERAGIHAGSPDYALDLFRSDPGHLSGVVRFDLPRLGDIAGLRAVHLQCHIGTDTLSLARLGAQVTGLDFSPASLQVARDLAAGAVEYVQAEVYSAVDVLGRERFDLVYTGIGALCWLPDIDRWAAVVSDLLVPGGRLFLREGHPVLWALDEQTPGLHITYPYFTTPEPLVEAEEQTYVATEARLQNATTHSWNHGIGEIITALLDHGLSLTQFVEHRTVPWNALEGQMVVDARGEYALIDRPERLPLSYTLQALKRAAPPGGRQARGPATADS
jgi:SAM-dependent methyltransferase